MAKQAHIRDDGFYWVREEGYPTAVMRWWLDSWWECGSDMSVDDERVCVLAGPLPPPALPPSS